VQTRAVYSTYIEFNIKFYVDNYVIFKRQVMLLNIRSKEDLLHNKKCLKILTIKAFEIVKVQIHIQIYYFSDRIM